MKTLSLITIIALMLFLNISYLYPQQLSANDIVDISVSVTKKGVLFLDIKLEIKDGWNINANKPLDEYLTPTSIALNDSSLFSASKIEYPLPEIIRLGFSETDLALYQGEVNIKVVLKPRDDLDNKELKIEGYVLYQPCNDQTCLFPTKKPFSVLFKPD